ncbi:hypothetical protein B0H63DRAFT_488795 [Podospora didyma]|uniref:Uncharacterized protein n=1 Tax=Podospora didyma TaxID=330526 RepID=A0AAE0K352_9PEZI|nr:hypothetical protein B0H63DRAFT_488795 [Podospora didyma]
MSTALYRPQTSLWSLSCGPVTKFQYGTGVFTSWLGGSTTSTLPSSCGPPGWYISSSVIPYYSPAICPSGYTAACSWYDSAQGPTPLAGETAYNCLPSGYTCGSSWAYTHGVEITSTSNSAPIFAIRWKSSDLSLLATHPLTSGTPAFTATSSSSRSSSATSSVSSTTGTSSPIQTGDTGSGGNGVSTGVLAGAVVGAVLGVLLLVGATILVFCIVRRRKKRSLGAAGNLPHVEQQPYNPELDGTAITAPAVYQPELDGKASLSAVPAVAQVTSFHSEEPVKTHTPAPQYHYYEIDSERAPLEPQELPTQYAASPGYPPPPSQQQQYYQPAPVFQPAESSPPPVGSLYGGNYAPIPTSPPLGSTSSVLSSPPPPSSMSGFSGQDELAQLREQQAKLEAKRKLLTQMEQLQEEEDRVKRRIEELQRGSVQQ